jgi:hypothetical protein
MTSSDAERLDDTREQAARVGGSPPAAARPSTTTKPCDSRSNERWRSSARPPTRSASQLGTRHPDIDSCRITRLRILLAHHYHRVDPRPGVDDRKDGGELRLPVVGVFEIVDDRIAAWRESFDLATVTSALS